MKVKEPTTPPEKSFWYSHQARGIDETGVLDVLLDMGADIELLESCEQLSDENQQLQTAWSAGEPRLHPPGCMGRQMDL